MAQENTTGQNLATSGTGTAVTSGSNIQLGTIAAIDTTGLTDQQIQMLKVKQAEGMIDLQRRGLGVQTDVAALEAGLGVLAANTKAVADAGNSVTITNTQTNEFGRTEIIMGNTATAGKGKLSKSQTGQRDFTLLYVGIGAIVLVVLALIFAR